MTGIAVPWKLDAMMAALSPVDEAFHQSELRWGIGRLERLVSASTLEAYRRGWEQWRKAIETYDTPAVQALGPKMIQALAFMEREAEAAGQAPLSVETWETLLPSGQVLVLVRSSAEASAVGRAAGLGRDAELPPDLLRIVQHQHAGRDIIVWTLGEVSRVLAGLDVVNEIKRSWPGATIKSGPVTREGDISDWVREDPIRALIETPIGARA